jgi:uncharacterized lipoprotein YmbA
MQKTRRSLLLGMVVLCACLAGCARTQATRYYTLSPVAPGSSERAGPSSLSLGVGPVILPEYLDRPQMMTVAGANEVAFAEFHRWADPLDEMLARVLKEDLAALLATENVAPYPWPAEFEPDVVVEVEVLELAGQPDGGVTLEARWLVRAAGGRGRVRRTQIEMPAEAGDYAALAAAASRAVAALSREIADAIEASSG